jgi:hypothetical protein
MINNQTPEKYYIKVITCKKRSGSSVGIYKNGEYYSIGVSREKCYNYNRHYPKKCVSLKI